MGNMAEQGTTPYNFVGSLNQLRQLPAEPVEDNIFCCCSCYQDFDGIEGIVRCLTHDEITNLLPSDRESVFPIDHYDSTITICRECRLNIPHVLENLGRLKNVYKRQYLSNRATYTQLQRQAARPVDFSFDEYAEKVYQDMRFYQGEYYTIKYLFIPTIMGYLPLRETIYTCNVCDQDFDHQESGIVKCLTEDEIKELTTTEHAQSIGPFTEEKFDPVIAICRDCVYDKQVSLHNLTRLSQHYLTLHRRLVHNPQNPDEDNGFVEMNSESLFYLQEHFTLAVIVIPTIEKIFRQHLQHFDCATCNEEFQELSGGFVKYLTAEEIQQKIPSPNGTFHFEPYVSICSRCSNDKEHVLQQLREQKDTAFEQFRTYKRQRQIIKKRIDRHADVPDAMLEHLEDLESSEKRYYTLEYLTIPTVERYL